MEKRPPRVSLFGFFRLLGLLAICHCFQPWHGAALGLADSAEAPFAKDNRISYNFRVRICKCVARTREEALSEAMGKYGADIQVVYEREFLYGFFNSKWVEVGFFPKEVEERGIEAVRLPSDAVNLALCGDELAALLCESDFSARTVRSLTARFYSEAHERRLSASLGSVREFLSAEMGVMAKEASFFNSAKADLPSFPDVIALASPFGIDCAAFISRLAGLFRANERERGIVVADFCPTRLDADRALDGDVDVIEAPDAESLARIRSSLDGRRLFVNAHIRFSRDAWRISGIFDALGAQSAQSVLALLPSGVKASKGVQAIGDCECLALAFESFSAGESVGNMMSICAETKAKIAFLERNGEVMGCDADVLGSLLWRRLGAFMDADAKEE